MKVFSQQIFLTVKFLYKWLSIDHEKNLSKDEAFLTAVYRAYLGRDPDENGKAFFLPKLRNGTARRIQIIHAVISSIEFRQRALLPVSPLEALHSARMAMVHQHLPPAEKIVDLGGASNHSPFGALLLMGYPYTPKEITIIDLPVEQRLGTWDATSEQAALTTPEGTTVSYLYRSLADLAPIHDASVDMVFSGESIEHVSEGDADRAIQEAYRVLKPGGYLCLDTPNRALTILHSPDALIHPEHQKEYRVPELTAKVERCGFVITAAKAICPMPKALATGQFDYAEMVRNNVVTEHPEEGYLFFLQCRKPEQK